MEMGSETMTKEMSDTSIIQSSDREVRSIYGSQEVLTEHLC